MSGSDTPETNIDIPEHIDLDWMSNQILTALQDLGGEAQASEVREAANIDANQSLHYRVDNKLTPAGLVDKQYGDSPPGQIDPAILSLTDKGSRYLATEHLDTAPPDENIKARLDQLEEQLDARFDTIHDRLDTLEGRIDDIEQELDGGNDLPSFEALRLGFIAMEAALREDTDLNLTDHHPAPENVTQANDSTADD